MRKVGLGDLVEVGEQVPAPRLFALPGRIECDRVREWHGIAVVLAVLVARDNGSHDDVQWDACVADAQCTFEDDLTLHAQVRPFLAEKKGGGGDYVPWTISCSVIGVRRDNSR